MRSLLRLWHRAGNDPVLALALVGAGCVVVWGVVIACLWGAS